MEHKDSIYTKCVHGGEVKSKHENSITNPIVQTATFVFENIDALSKYMANPNKREYGRYGNPTVEVAENKLACLENGKRAFLFSTGMTAVCIPLLALMEKGTHIIATRDVYRRTRQFIRDMLGQQYGLEYTIVEPNHEAIEKAIQPNTKIIYSEAPTNPFLRVLDIPKVVDIAKKHNLITMIDSTLATPYNMRPLDYGIDIVIHSITKYLGGHNDLLGGVVISNNDDLMNQIREYRHTLGGNIDPQSAYLLIRGLKTFALRMDQHNKNGLAMARFLESHPKVLKVNYHGLESHPDYQIAKKLMTGFSSLMSFEVDADFKKTGDFIDHVKIPFLGPSLGGVESLIEQICIVSYFGIPREERLPYGITDNLARISVGIEDVEDLIADLDQALNKI